MTVVGLTLINNLTSTAYMVLSYINIKEVF